MLYYMLLSLNNGLKRSSYHQWGVGERLWVEKGWNRCHWGSIAKYGNFDLEKLFGPLLSLRLQNCRA